MPVYLGALGLKGACFADAHCDGPRVAAQWEPSYAAMLWDALQAGAEAAGRPHGSVDLVIQNWTFLHPDRDLAWAARTKYSRLPTSPRPASLNTWARSFCSCQLCAPRRPAAAGPDQ